MSLPNRPPFLQQLQRIHGSVAQLVRAVAFKQRGGGLNPFWRTKND